MGKQINHISPRIQAFIEQQKLFYTGTAGADGRVNVSPKGMDSFRVLGPNKVAWLNLTGSGNETAAHILEVNRITLMFCAFEGPPMILRLYGNAKAYHETDPEWAELSGMFPAIPGARQVFVVEVESVQTSCGMGVPFMDYQGERDGLIKWAENHGPEGLENYKRQKNVLSIDGKPTGLPV